MQRGKRKWKDGVLLIVCCTHANTCSKDVFSSLATSAVLVKSKYWSGSLGRFWCEDSICIACWSQPRARRDQLDGNLPTCKPNCCSGWVPRKQLSPVPTDCLSSRSNSLSCRNHNRTHLQSEDLLLPHELQAFASTKDAKCMSMSRY